MPLLKNMAAEEVAALRAAEEDVDKAYSDNPLLRDNLGTALWAILSFVEDLELRPVIQGRAEPCHRAAALIDETLNALKFPLAWLHATCDRSGAIRRNYDSTRYQAAWDLLDLAKRYYGFSGPFQYWSKGELGLRLEGTRIIAELAFERTAEYEAYNRLIDYKEDQEEPLEAEALAADLDSRVRVKGDRFPGRDDLGDVDLAIISDAEASCLLLELKWFIAPAEVREIFDRREELQKGITQVQSRIEAVRAGCPACRSFLALDPKMVDGGVASRNWIGDSSIQKESWPVIAQQHLVAKP